MLLGMNNMDLILRNTVPAIGLLLLICKSKPTFSSSQVLSALSAGH